MTNQSLEGRSIDLREPTTPCHSRHKRSKLEWVDPSGIVYRYYHDPLTKACFFILVQEACERLAYYGILPNLQLFFVDSLTVTDNSANSLINIFQALVYFTPLFSAIVADTWLGIFKTIIIFSGLYMGGLVLLCLSAIQEISQKWMVYVSLMVFIAIGAGGIKSCVNVMGASQYHPTEHQAEITRFFTFFYASINIGALVGGFAVPITQTATNSFFIGYLIPLVSFAIATTVFVTGSPRYVKVEPQGSQVLEIMKVWGHSLRNLKSINNCKQSHGGPFKDQFIEDTRSLGHLLPLFALTVPFNICYNQMSTAFLSQGKKMKSSFFGLNMPPALMQNIDPLGVILGSFAVEYFYSFLRQRNTMPSILTRFFIGCLMGTASLLCAVGVEREIMASPDPWSISIWWQTPQFILIALGEIFLISTSYEVAFTYAPDALKAVGSAINLLFLAIASFLSALLFNMFASWMPDYNSSVPSSWQNSHFDYFFAILAAFCLFSGFASLALNPYFKRNIRKPSERENSGSELINTTRENTITAV